jgi:hypothetical protein
LGLVTRLNLQELAMVDPNRALERILAGISRECQVAGISNDDRLELVKIATRTVEANKAMQALIVKRAQFALMIANGDAAEDQVEEWEKANLEPQIEAYTQGAFQLCFGRPEITSSQLMACSAAFPNASADRPGVEVFEATFSSYVEAVLTMPISERDRVVYDDGKQQKLMWQCAADQWWPKSQMLLGCYVNWLDDYPGWDFCSEVLENIAGKIQSVIEKTASPTDLSTNPEVVMSGVEQRVANLPDAKRRAVRAYFLAIAAMDEAGSSPESRPDVYRWLKQNGIPDNSISDLEGYSLPSERQTFIRYVNDACSRTGITDPLDRTGPHVTRSVVSSSDVEFSGLGRDD